MTSTDPTLSRPLTRHLPRLIVAMVFAFAAFWILHDLAADLAEGGNPWKQGDWLINDLAGPLRRGPLGSLLIRAADALGLGPLGLLIPLQSVLALAFLGLTLAAAWPLLPSSPALALLLTGPAMIPAFWTQEPQAALRKEVIAFLAFALVAAAQTRARPPAAMLAGGGVLFLAAILSHEGLAVLFPAFALQLALTLGQRGSGRGVITAALAILFATTALIVAFALTHAQAASTEAVCQPLLDRGMGHEICTGAIWFMDKDAAWVAQQLSDFHARMHPVRMSLLWYAFLLPALALTAWGTDRPGAVVLLFLATALPVLPLYLVAIDWGRWLVLHVTSFSFLLITLLHAGRLRPARPAPLWLILPVLLAGLVWGPEHRSGLQPGPLQRLWIDARTEPPPP